jgi:hypothetical protein
MGLLISRPGSVVVTVLDGDLSGTYEQVLLSIR